MPLLWLLWAAAALLGCFIVAVAGGREVTSQPDKTTLYPWLGARGPSSPEHSEFWHAHPALAPGAGAFTDEGGDKYAGKVTVVTMTPNHFLSGFERNVTGCTWRGQRLGCEFSHAHDDWAIYHADALWWHAPSICFNGSAYRAFHGQPLVLGSMESSTYYPCLDNPDFMARFDLEMSYRMAVPISYLREDHLAAWTDRQAEVPWDLRENAVAYVQSNCDVPSRRDALVESLMKFRDLRVNSYGKCLNNAALGHGESKGTAFRRHRFCLVIENSFAVDYVTEKLWDAFAAGCVPVYWGALNVEDILPAPEAVIDYRRLGSSAALRRELLRLGADRGAWEARVAWRRRPEAQLAPGFRRQLELVREGGPQCALCRGLMEMRGGNWALRTAHRALWHSRAPRPADREL